MAEYSPREDLLRLYCRQGCRRLPIGMNLCPTLVDEFQRRYPGFHGDYLDFFGAPYRFREPDCWQQDRV